MTRPARERTSNDVRKHVPVHVVWEITLACDLKCRHCGSRAGVRRDRELDTAECLEVIESLARLGTREVTLIGGEAYLRADWLDLVRAIRAHGMYCAVQTGGRNLTDKRLAAAVEAGVQGIGVSVDGLAPLHDELRGVTGSFDRAIDAVARASRSGIHASVNTQIGARTMPDLPDLMTTIIEAGATHWQIQLTVAMGNAVDNDALLLQPHQLLELMPLLARLYREGQERGLLVMNGNNIGYFGPYEHLWRGLGDESLHWTGCAAGQNVIGLEADGTMKGCPSLRTAGYAGGNVRDATVEDIWNEAEAIHFGRLRSVDDLWGFCRTCYYADVCRGGCTWTADSLFGRPGNNPYCHYRALELDKRGLRERVVKKRPAPNEPFAIGEFELLLEAVPGRSSATAHPAEPSRSSSERLVQIRPRSRSTSPSAQEGRALPRLDLCGACNQYIDRQETTCPHCGADVARASARRAETARQNRAIMQSLERALSAAKEPVGDSVGNP